MLKLAAATEAFLMKFSLESLLIIIVI